MAQEVAGHVKKMARNNIGARLKLEPKSPKHLETCIAPPNESHDPNSPLYPGLIGMGSQRFQLRPASLRAFYALVPMSPFKPGLVNLNAI